MFREIVFFSFCLSHFAVKGGFYYNVRVCFFFYYYGIIVETGDRAVRLVQDGVSSQSYRMGVVQIYYQGEWGTICEDSFFGYDEANVICIQLAYTGASTYSNNDNS